MAAFPASWSVQSTISYNFDSGRFFSTSSKLAGRLAEPGVAGVVGYGALATVATDSVLFSGGWKKDIPAGVTPSLTDMVSPQQSATEWYVALPRSNAVWIERPNPSAR